MGRLMSVVVVTGAFINLLLSNGFRHCIGLFFVFWQEEFGGTAEEIGWIGSFVLIGYAVAGICVAMFGSRISCRVITSVGGALACIALACCIFAKEVWHMFLLMFITGFGLALVRNASLTVMGFYVKKRIGLAYGFVGAGSSFGLLLLSPIFTLLIEFYSWRGAMLVISGIMANQCVTGALQRTTSSEATANAVKLGTDSGRDDDDQSIEIQQEEKPDRAYFGYLSVESRRKSTIGLVGTRIRKTSSQVADGIRRTSIQVAGGIRRKSVQVADGITRSNTVAILTNIRLLSFNVSIFLRGFAFFASMVHFVKLCLDNNISLSKSALLLSIIGMSGAILCLTHGIVLDKKLITPLHLLSLALFTAGAACIMIGIYVNFMTLTVFAIVFGAAASICNGLVPSSVRQILDEDIHLVKGTLGISMTVAAAGGLIGIPVIGRIFDITQNYSISCYVAGGVFIASGILHCMDHLLVAYQRRRKRNYEEETVSRNGLERTNSDVGFTTSSGIIRNKSTVSFTTLPESEIA